MPCNEFGLNLLTRKPTKFPDRCTSLGNHTVCILGDVITDIPELSKGFQGFLERRHTGSGCPSGHSWESLIQLAKPISCVNYSPGIKEQSRPG